MDIFFSSTLKIESYSGIHLVQDHIGTNLRAAWDDYGYIVKFQVYYVADRTLHRLGFIRLLINGHANTSDFFIKKGNPESEKKIVNIKDIFSPRNAVSLPLKVDYYQKLNTLLGVTKAKSFLRLVCDGSFYYYRYDVFKDWPGFDESIMREGTASEAILQKGRRIAIGKYLSEDSFQITLSSDSDIIEPLTFSFDRKRKIGEKNINVLVGKNGTGKTHALKRISEIVTGMESIKEKWPYFHKLIVVAYSPFEDFHTVDSLLIKMDENYRIAKGLQKTNANIVRRRLNVNKYAYVGFRDLKGTFNVDHPRNHSVLSLAKIIAFDRENDWWDDDNRFSILFDTLLLCMDFDHISVEVKGIEERLSLNRENIHRVTKKQIESFNPDGGLLFVKNDQQIQLSSGQQVYSYMIPAIVAEIEKESLIIIDEPELYLHPTLEVGLINMLKLLLSQMDSYAIIATHSAIITREVDRTAVNILRKSFNSTVVSMPNLQTYGASIESIIGEIFDDYFTAKPFQSEIDEALKTENSNAQFLLSSRQEMGDEALAYVLAQIDDEIIVERE